MAEKEVISKITPSEWLLSNKAGTFQQIMAFFLSGWCIGIWLFHAYCAFFGQPEAMLFRPTHVSFFMVAAFMYFPLRRKSWSDQFNLFFLIDLLCVALVLFIQIYMFIDVESFQARGTISATGLDIFLGTIMVFLTLEATRRVVGWPLVVTAALFFIYSVGAEYFPGLLNAPGMPFRVFIDRLFFGTLGLYGIAVYVMATYVIMFIFFGSFLLQAGGGEFFIKLAYAIAGRRVAGPAKVAVVSSALMGTVSGSCVANVVTTGTFTIPLMKSAGFRSETAGAIEAVASTGGQIMPPVMGAAAFVMAYFLGIPYLDVCKAAAIPACLYFFAVYCMIHLQARKRGLGPIVVGDIPSLKNVLKEGYHHLLPLATIIVFLIMGYSPMIVGLAGVVAAFVASFKQRQTMLTLKKLIRAMELGVQGTIMVAIAGVAVGIILCSVGQTAFGPRITSLIFEASGGNLLAILLLTMIISIILSMGLTTIVLYISLTVTIVPALINLGVLPIAAHLFVLWYGVMGYITPPVAFAAYAGAAVAGSNPFRTGLIASKFGIAGFLVPFLFVYKSELLLVSPSWILIIVMAVESFLAIISIACCIQGWLFTRIGLSQRILLFAAFVLLVYPSLFASIMGLLILASLVFWQRNVVISKFIGNPESRTV
jgi:TRAP transporter 4TM/12TM fusion protein